MSRDERTPSIIERHIVAPASVDCEPADRHQAAIKPLLILGVILSALMMLAVFGGFVYGVWSVLR